jgi:hypothetical protein
MHFSAKGCHTRERGYPVRRSIAIDQSAPEWIIRFLFSPRMMTL